jgi:hypothetical protein
VALQCRRDEQGHRRAKTPTLEKQTGITTLLISQVMKRGEIAGPQLLGHRLDLVIMMQPALILKCMLVAKNRQGSVSPQPIPITEGRVEMKPTSRACLSCADGLGRQPSGRQAHVKPASARINIVLKQFVDRLMCQRERLPPVEPFPGDHSFEPSHGLRVWTGVQESDLGER